MHVRVRTGNLHGLAYKVHKAGELTEKCQAQMYLIRIKKCSSLIRKVKNLQAHVKMKLHPVKYNLRVL